MLACVMQKRDTEESMEQSPKYTDEQLDSAARILDTATGAMRRQNEFRREIPLTSRFTKETPQSATVEQQVSSRTDEYDPSLPWQVQGACTREDPELFFPPKNNSKAAQLAKDICSRCVVVKQCLNYALNVHEQEQGVWGGNSEDELRALRRRKKRYGHI